MRLGTAERQRFLAEILNISETEELRFVNAFVRPRLKVDFLKMLPLEVGLRVLFFDCFLVDNFRFFPMSRIRLHWLGLHRFPDIGICLSMMT